MLALLIATVCLIIWTGIVAFVNSAWEKRLGIEGVIIGWVVLAVAWLSWWLG